ncbi:START domain-containing protein [Mucilaginibacter mallensis]|uniref:START domain-containing protein n=1 Tax=Mucilaginibacter mallensis TaxID=652787 RepID=A0A1H1P0P1_MUCMA|nr:START domain-containing protein [Mucilaginibacter mallensis]SDS04772.1 START domain-containing protein [Mucilaginibacter mallensis]
MKIKSLTIFTLFLFMLTAASAQDKWELRRNEDGITIYSRQSPDGKLVELRLLCQLDATPGELIKQLMDIDSYSSWVYSNKKSGIIKKINDHDIIYFTEAHLPWPIQDRDLVVELNIEPTTTPNAQQIIQVKSINGILPPKKHFIRVPYSMVTWRITPVPGNKINVDYTFSLDPGGSIPRWLINLTLTTGPYKSFVKLRELLKAERDKR